MKITIGTRLAAFAAALILCVLLVSFLSWRSNEELGELLNGVTDQDYPSVRLALEMELAKTGQADDLGRGGDAGHNPVFDNLPDPEDGNSVLFAREKKGKKLLDRLIFCHGARGREE